MFYIMQKNLYAEENFNELVRQLEVQKLDFQIVNVIPFAHKMDPDVNVEGKVFVFGATAMGKISKKKNWNPGYIDDNIVYHNLIDNYKGDLFNYDCEIVRFGDLITTSKLPQWQRIFVRPVNDGKSFAGMTTTWHELYAWEQQLHEIGYKDNSNTTITADDYIVISEEKKIQSEYRFFVVDGEVITGSQYKLGDRVIYSNKVDKEVYHYAQRMVNIWVPNRAFAIDICRANDRFYVLEINSINSAGFYHCDMGKLIHALEIAFS